MASTGTLTAEPHLLHDVILQMLLRHLRGVRVLLDVAAQVEIESKV